MTILDTPIAVVDFETTGFDAKVDRAIEIGIVHLDGGKIVSEWSTLLNPERPIPPEATRIHGIGAEQVAGAPTFREAFEDISTRLSGRVLCAYNAPFDRRFMVAEYGRLDLPPQLHAHREAIGEVWLDPLVWVKQFQKYEKGKKLGDVCKRMGITLDGAHRATADCVATAQVLIALADRLPSTIADCLEYQDGYAAAQDKDFAAWKARQPQKPLKGEF